MSLILEKTKLQKFHLKLDSKFGMSEIIAYLAMDL